MQKFVLSIGLIMPRYLVLGFHACASILPEMAESLNLGGIPLSSRPDPA